MSKVTDEYKLTEAGLFTEVDLLDFVSYEREKGNTVRKIDITRRQANHLLNGINGIKPKKTGKKLVDFWTQPSEPTDLMTIHGVEVWIEE